MKYFLGFLLIFAIVGCQEPDKDELKRINGIKPTHQKDSEKSNQKLVKKSLFDGVKENKTIRNDSIKKQLKVEAQDKVKVKKDTKPLEQKKQIVVIKKIDEVQKQKLQNEQKLKELEVQNKKELKELEFKNRQKLQENKIKLEEKEKEYNQQKWIFEKKSNYKLYQMIIALIAFLLLVLFLLYYFYKRKTTQSSHELEKEKFHREKDLELYKLQNERLEKIVDIVTTKDLSKENEGKLLNIISEETRKSSIVEVEPKKKGLFYKS